MLEHISKYDILNNNVYECTNKPFGAKCVEHNTFIAVVFHTNFALLLTMLNCNYVLITQYR